MPSRGSPKKDPNAPKANYNLSRLERAKRATRQKLNNEKRQAEKAAKKLQKHRQNAKRIKNTAKNLSNRTSTVVDMGDELNSIQPVADLVEDQEVIFKPNSGPQEEFLSASEEDVL